MRYGMQIVLAAVLITCGAARAQDWPTRPITLVVPYPAGGPTDAVGRLFAQQMSESLNRQIVVENIAGAGGTTGAGRIAHASPDGYRVLFVGSALTYSQFLYQKPPFTSVTDFTPVGLLTRQSLVLMARKNVPADGLASFIRYVKENKTASFGSAGAGSSSHLGCVMLNLAIGASATHVPYRGVAPAMQDLIGGRIDYFCTLTGTAVPQIESGLIKAIAVMTKDRAPMLPNLPSTWEQGFRDFEASTWFGFYVPKGTPAAVIKRLRDATVEALDTPAVQEQLLKSGSLVSAPDPRSTEYLKKFTESEIAKNGAPIKAAGISME
jgi:tripartite-type tricarboxylate transporter receptor subunit TctC